MAGYPDSNLMRRAEDMSDEEIVTLLNLHVEDTDYETLYKQSKEVNENLIQNHETVVVLFQEFASIDSNRDAWKIQYLKKKIVELQARVSLLNGDRTIRSEMAGFSADPDSNLMRRAEDVSDEKIVTLLDLSIENTDYETLYKQSKEENRNLLMNHESVVALLQDYARIDSARDAWQIEHLKKKIVELEARLSGNDTSPQLEHQSNLL